MNTNYVLLAFLLVLNIIFRIPWTPHGVDVVDSRFVWSLANSISASGYIMWALHPTSFFGLYPLSYPSGSPVALSISSQLTGVDVEYVILIFGFFLAILGMLGSYTMALKMWDNHLFAFFTSFAFSTAPIFIEYTRWTATSRNLFLSLFPLFLWTVFWFNKKDNYINKQLLLIIIILITLGSAHRLSFLLSLIFASYVLTKIIWHVKETPYVLKYSVKLSNNSRFFGLVLLWVLAFSLQFSGIGFYSGIWHDYQSGAFVEGTSLSTILLNLSTNYIGHIGIMMPFGMIGFIMLLMKRNKDFNEIFIMGVVIFSTAILALGLYVSQFLLPFASIFIALCICKLLELSQRIIEHQDLIKRKKAPALAIVIVICLVTSIGFSCYMINRHMYAPLGDTGDKTWMTSDIPAVGSFLKEHGETVFLSNDWLMASRIYAATGVPTLGTEIHALINGWIEAEVLNINILPWYSLNTNVDNIYRLNETLCVDNDVRIIYAEDYRNNESMLVLNKYKIGLFVANNQLLGELVGSNFNVRPSASTKSVTNFGYRIYDNEKESVWLLRKNLENKVR